MKPAYKKQRARHNAQDAPNLSVTDFNDETRAAMREARLISDGKIPAKSFANVDELLKDLMSDADD